MKSACHNELISGMSLHCALTEVVQMIWGIDHNYRSTETRIEPENMIWSAVTDLKAYKAYTDTYPQIAAAMDRTRDMLEKLNNPADIQVIETLGSGREHNQRQADIFRELRSAETILNDARADLIQAIGENLIKCECGK